MHGLIGGSWAFPVYSEVFNIKYALKTFDIDLVVDVITSKSGNYVDLEKLIEKGMLAEIEE